jgi:hypothetical protein
MPKGISVFSGMNYSLEQNLEYMNKAKQCGFESVFTSLHIPEADYEMAIEEFKTMVDSAKKDDMQVIADISPRTFRYLDASMGDFKVLKELGLYGIRVDFGFSPQEIAQFTKNPYEMKIEINASTVTKRFLKEFEDCSPDYSNFQACHNYYPRLNTGISLETYLYKNALLKKYKIEISTFIPSLVNRRGPVFEGLPSLEKHRFMEPQVAAKHLFATGTDNVIFGDSIPSDNEIESVGRLNEDVMELRMISFATSSLEKDIIFECVHENRPDCAEDVVRSTSSRENLPSGVTIQPHNNIERNMGNITIDNINYLRYCGELQICKKSLPADKRVNVVGSVLDEEVFLIDYIGEETRFSFAEQI